MDPLMERIAQIFFPYAWKVRKKACDNKTRFAHYTSAESAMSMLHFQEVWMRKSSSMNDFMEVQHGLQCVRNSYNGNNAGKKFKDVMNGMFEGITDEIEKPFNDWTPHFLTNTYFTCVSEHYDSEDNFGRLSMWRAYGDTAGVAVVMNPTAFFNPSNALKAYTNPVAYLSDQEFEVEFTKVADNILNERSFVQSLGRDQVKNIAFQALRFATLCTKHPGFKEEVEWRVVYSPSLENSSHLKKEIQTVRGIPQPIYKIPLKNIPNENLNISIPFLIDRIIIGPSQYPLVMHEAFCDLLSEAGVKKPKEKVFISNIPIRR